MTLPELQAKIGDGGPYNSVSAFMLPSGELALVLSHTATDDDMVLVRVREDIDVLDPWNEAVAYETVNLGGDWKQPTPCDAVLWHGPGHQSRTKCRIKGPHTIHRAVYGSGRQQAEWCGDEAMTGFFDEPPR
jgi:hypothetical protein